MLHTTEGYILRLPETWLDFDPVVERSLVEDKAEAISPCFNALLSGLLGAETGVEFSLLAFDDAVRNEKPTGIPAALAVGHVEAPAPLPITLLTPIFTRQMNAIKGVTVVETSKLPKINGMGAARSTLSIQGLCDAQGRPIPTTGYQIFLLDGSDVFILTFIAPDAVFENYQPVFTDIGESFRRSQ